MEGGRTEIQLGDKLKRKFAFSMSFKEKPCAQSTVLISPRKALYLSVKALTYIHPLGLVHVP